MSMRKCYLFFIFCLLLSGLSVRAQDMVADNMVLYQRSSGGWPKHIGNERIDYTKKLSEAEKAGLIDDASMNDATIDNDATNKEIRYLVKAFKQTGNTRYLASAETGVRYLLKAQYANGGWPQFYPDTSLYRSEVTYNDNAMVNTLNVLYDLSLQVNDMEVMNAGLRAPAAEAVKKGVGCILVTQVRVNGVLTSWCAQYDRITLQPAKARSYELVSLSGEESVGIVEFLMRLPHPTAAIKDAVSSAVAWFRKVKIEGYKYVNIADPKQPNGRDRVIQPEAGSVIWARFYEIGTDRPFFSGRDGIKKYTVAEIEHERRNGYAWYGTWPLQLINEKYPAWLASTR